MLGTQFRVPRRLPLLLHLRMKHSTGRHRGPSRYEMFATHPAPRLYPPFQLLTGSDFPRRFTHGNLFGCAKPQPLLRSVLQYFYSQRFLVIRSLLGHQSDIYGIILPGECESMADIITALSRIVVTSISSSTICLVVGSYRYHLSWKIPTAHFSHIPSPLSQYIYSIYLLNHPRKG